MHLLLERQRVNQAIPSGEAETEGAAGTQTFENPKNDATVKKEILTWIIKTLSLPATPLPV